MTLGKRPPHLATEGSDHHHHHHHPTSSSPPSSSSKENHRKSSQSHRQTGSSLDLLPGDSSKKSMMTALRGETVGESSSSLPLPWTADRDTPDDTPDDSPRLTYDDGTSGSNHGGRGLRSSSLRQRRRGHDPRNGHASSESHHRRQHRGRGLGPSNGSESLGESEGDFESSSGGGGGRRGRDRDHRDDDDCDSDVYVASDAALGQAVLNTASAMFRGNQRHDGSLARHRAHDGTSGMMNMDG